MRSATRTVEAPPAGTAGPALGYRLTKRAIDLALALAGLLVLAPLLAVLALLIKLDDSGPVLYRGLRVGRNGVPFRMLKFRTMIADADRSGPSSTAGDDLRITHTGRLMRRFKLDELPQLLNVLRGDMSLVGPRPQVQWAVDLYTPEQRALLSVRPGVTDYASLRFRDEAEILRGSADPDQAYMEKIAPLKMELGLHYVNSPSIVTDLKLIFATCLVVVGVNPAWCLPDDATIWQSRRTV